MSWLKDVVVDIAATVLIIAAVLTSQTILGWIVWGYTGLLLFTKLLVQFGGFTTLMKKSQTEAPEWFSHLLYATNTGVLLFFHWWYAGVGWALIWGLSYLTQRKIQNR